MELPHFSKIQEKIRPPQIDIESLKVQIAKDLNDVLAGRLTPKEGLLLINLGTFLSSDVKDRDQIFRPIVEWLHDAGYMYLSWDSDLLRSFPSKERVILKIHLNL
jgi:hypothetical protein